MKSHIFPLSNLGMSRDRSVSKPQEGKAFENRNIRITAGDHDTFMSVTNERGNKRIENLHFEGTLIGWNKLNRTVILFTHEGETDRIYKVTYKNGEFEQRLICERNLGLSCDFPIESVVDYENEDIQKIYWVDGLNQFRFLNFADSYLDKYADKFTDDWFDVNRSPGIDISVDIDRKEGGNQRANGTVQYFITLYNKHGQETTYVYCSPVVYLSPSGRGGSPDETNTNLIELKISKHTKDSLYDYIRVYALVRTTYNSGTNAYIVSENATSDDSIVIVDDGKYLSTVDVTSLLYLGSRDIVAGTMTHKDNTLFIGDISYLGNDDDESISNAIKDTAFKDNGWESAIVTFEMSGNTEFDKKNGTLDIPYVVAEGTYPYESQLNYTKDRISTFKGGEKYRFAIQFRRSNGSLSKAYWVGDVVNPLYPEIVDGMIRRPIAVCRLNADIVEAAYGDKFVSAQLMIAQASYSDRSIKAQGIINPTLFNLHDRFSDSPFSIPSWITRPRGGDVSYKHFSPLIESNSVFSELQCSNWEDTGSVPMPFIFKDASGKIANMPEGYVKYRWIWIKYVFYAQGGISKYWGSINIMKSEKESVTTESDFEYNELFWFGGGNETFYASRLKCIADLKKIYIDEGVPQNYGRLSDQEVIDACERALNKTSLDHWKAEEPIDCEKSLLSFTSNNENLVFSKLNRQHFFVDEGIVTFNSPEIEYEKVNLDRNEGLKLRIVGVSRFTSNMTDYIMESEDSKYIGERLLKKEFTTNNISDSVNGLLSYPIYVEKKLRKINDVDPGKDIHDYTDDDYEFDYGNTGYMMYLWHKSGSIIGFSKDAENNGWSRLKTKTFANLHFAYDTVYGPSWEDSPSDIRQCTIVGDHIYGMKSEGVNRSYLPNVNTLVVTPEGMKYPIYYSDADCTPGEPVSLSKIRYSNDPVSIKFKTSSHALISLSSVDGHKTILPYIFDSGDLSDRFVSPIRPEGTTGPFIPWETSGAISGIDINVFKKGEVDLSLGSFDGFSFSFNENGTVDLVKNYDSVAISNLDEAYRGFSSYKNLYALFRKNDGTLYLVDAKNYSNNFFHCSIKWSGNTGGDRSHLSWESDCYKQSVKGVNVTVYATVWGDERLLFDSISQSGYRSIDVTAYDGNSLRVEFDIEFVDGTRRQVNLHVVSGTDELIDGDKYVEYTDENGIYGDIAINNAKYISLSELTESMKSYNVYDGYMYILDVKEGETGVSELIKNDAISENMFVSPNQARFGNDDFVYKVGLGSKYLFVGELYYDYGDNDTRYGGTSESAIESNTFIVAGPSVKMDVINKSATLYGNEGDTFFQRWDSVKTLPYGTDDTNSVVDIASVMLETHINLDGRYDNLRGNPLLASLDYNKFGMLNEAYSQEDNFNTNIQTDVDLDTNNYRTYLTWTEEKHAADETDKWTHITLAASLKLDGDKGILRALRRIGNSIIAFQDTGISEILFNSRVQLATGNGVPVELANSGKVDGKRYISERNGCKNKWSIVSGKKGLYYVDDINKNISLLSGQGIVDVSGGAMFDAWVKEQVNKSSEKDYWTPNVNGKFISFYDDVNSDVYFYRWGAENDPCIVFNEKLDGFTSFYDYKDVPMMTNIHGRFLSFRDGSMWLQNEGLYGNFFGVDYGFGVTYRVTPDPILDKIWTNIEYRSDFYKVLDDNGNSIVDEKDLIGIAEYACDMTFDSYRVWSEYQDTADQGVEWGDDYGTGLLGPAIVNDRKKFRIWRICIGRDVNDSLMLNRIRNPWVYINLRKHSNGDGKHMMQLHDVMVKYFTTEDNNG